MSLPGSSASHKMENALAISRPREVATSRHRVKPFSRYGQVATSRHGDKAFSRSRLLATTAERVVAFSRYRDDVPQRGMTKGDWPSA